MLQKLVTVWENSICTYCRGHRHSVHESEAAVQMASLPIRHHPAVCAVVSTLPDERTGITEEMMLERGLTVDHSTVYRWVQAYAPELDKRCRPYLKQTNDSWRVDETYIEVKGKWKYLYQAVDSQGNKIGLYA